MTTIKNLLITAGPTREWMDPVRFLSNPSSGLMGILLSETLHRHNCSVTLVLGPTHLKPPKGIRVIPVETALEMAAAVKKNLSKVDAFIAAAAVGDWRFNRVSSTKIKKKRSDTMTVRLVKNPDILAAAGAYKGKRSKLLLVGFALETNRQLENAKEKLFSKNLDLIVANDPASFSTDNIRSCWIERDGTVRQFGNMSKRRLSEQVARWLFSKWKQK